MAGEGDEQVLINGNAVSWASVILKINGVRFWGFTSISYGDKRERTKGYGMGRSQAPRSRSKGKYTVNPFKLNGPPDSVHALREMLASLAQDGRSYGDVEVPIYLQYVEPGRPTMTVELERCAWVTDEGSAEEGTDPLKADVEFDPMRIRRNGKTLYDSSQEIR